MHYSETEVQDQFDPKSKDVGVIIGRFQLDYLHVGHKHIIETVIKNHDTIIIMLGIAAGIFTKNNPLDYNSRYLMIQSFLASLYLKTKHVIILPLFDCETNEAWSENIDIMLNTMMPTKSKLLYGGKDSFISSYVGKLDTYQLKEKESISGTERRKELKGISYSDSNFRAGIIHASQNIFTPSFQCVDAIIINDDKTKLMLGRKKNQTLWRFIGGFVDAKDESLEFAVKREVSEELGINFSIGDLKYLMSFQVKDWRYAYEHEKIMTAVFVTKHLYGKAKASDDIEECDWFDLEHLKRSYKDVLVSEHRKIFKTFIK